MSGSLHTRMNSLEIQILQDIGETALGNLGSLMALTLLYGVFISLFSVSIYMTIRRGFRNRATWAILIGTTVNFSIQTAQWIMMSTSLVFLVQIFLLHNGNASLHDRLILTANAQNRILDPMNDFHAVPLFISDAFVIWRASVLFTHKRVMFVPIVCLFATIGVDIAVLVIPPDENIAAGNALNWALLAFSIATNFISTGMIGYRLWIYRKHVLPDLVESNSPVHRVILTLVESGAVFCFIQVVFLIVQIGMGVISTFHAPIADAITQQTLFSLAALYPTFIVLICHNHSRIDEVASISMSIGNDIQFSTPRASQTQSVGTSTLGFSPPSHHSSILKANISPGDIEI